MTSAESVKFTVGVLWVLSVVIHLAYSFEYAEFIPVLLALFVTLIWTVAAGVVVLVEISRKMEGEE